MTSYHVTWMERQDRPGMYAWFVDGTTYNGGRTRHEVALSGTVGKAAKLTVKEDSGGGAPHFRRWEPFRWGVVKEAAE